MFVFDTDHLSLLQRDNGRSTSHLVSRLDECDEADFWVSIVSFHEQFQGWNAYLNKADDRENLVLGYARFEKLLKAFSGYQLLPFDEAAAEICSDFRKQKIRVGTMDLRIASIAIANDMTLLTRNTVDFERVPGLLFEDWTLPDV
ncbi:MAG: type II toxin-antitoxin system VapC family toxin [Planctomycetaceae bacterium]